MSARSSSRPPAAKLVEPGEGALDYPAMPPQARTRLDATAGDARLDVSSGQRLPAMPVGVPLVGMQFGFTKPGTFPYHCEFHANLHGMVVVKESDRRLRPSRFTGRRRAKGNEHS
jgi:hypothetical protein